MCGLHSVEVWNRERGFLDGWFAQCGGIEQGRGVSGWVVCTVWRYGTGKGVSGWVVCTVWRYEQGGEGLDGWFAQCGGIEQGGEGLGGWFAQCGGIEQGGEGLDGWFAQCGDMEQGRGVSGWVVCTVTSIFCREIFLFLGRAISIHKKKKNLSHTLSTVLLFGAA